MPVIRRLGIIRQHPDVPPHAPPLRRREQGTTLLEVMVAVAVLAAAMGATLASQAQSVSFSSDAKFSITAALLARHKAAELERIGPEDLISSQGDFGPDFPGYGWRTEVSEAGSAPMGGAERHLRRVDLTITHGNEERYAAAFRLYLFSPQDP